MKNQQLDAVEIAVKQRHLHLLGKVKNGQPLTKPELDELAQLEAMTKRKTKKSKKSAIATEQIIKTQLDAAKYAEVNTRTIRRWLKAGMPRTENGYYIKSMLDFFKQNEGQGPSQQKTRLADAEANLKETKAELAQIDLKIRRGELIHREDIDKQRIARIQAVKRALLGLGRKLAKQLAPIKNPRKIQARIDDEVRTIIDNFAR